MAEAPQESPAEPLSPLSRGLYALADADAAERHGLDLVECARAMAGASISALQLRAKGRGAGQVAGWLSQVVHGLAPGHPPIIVNDRADIARFGGAAGVHVGQTDLPVRELRRIYPYLLCGLSTHNLVQLEEALTGDGPDYVAFGPVFSTSSKTNAELATGMDALAEAGRRSRRRGVPLVAIGGVTEQRLAEVAQHADLIAAIGFLLPPPGASRPYTVIERTCVRLHQMILDSPGALPESE